MKTTCNPHTSRPGSGIGKHGSHRNPAWLFQRLSTSAGPDAVDLGNEEQMAQQPLGPGIRHLQNAPFISIKPFIHGLVLQLCRPAEDH